MYDPTPERVSGWYKAGLDLILVKTLCYMTVSINRWSFKGPKYLTIGYLGFPIREPQRLQVASCYIQRSQSYDTVTTQRPRYLLYTYMEP